VVSNERDLDQIFNFYDQSRDGRIDYKELSRVIEARRNGEELQAP
jgi:Ca2+-binding EF-hand superfamily protein